MTSTKLANLADTMLFAAVRGEAILAPRAAQLAQVLLDLSFQVKAMEDRPVPENARAPGRLRLRKPRVVQPGGVAR